jgi:hypothetical protein
MGIGIGITTRNRRDVFSTTVHQFRQFTDCPIVIIDDASLVPAPGATVRFERQQGVAKAKNAAIAALMDAGIEHLFLADDDVYPLVADWWKPYCDSPEPHLMYLFKDIAGRRRYRATPATVYEDDTHFALGWPRGCLLYLHRSVIERVGGMRPEFGLWGHEHLEYSERIHAAGLTTHRFQDVKGSNKLIYSRDEHYFEIPGFRRSVDGATRLESLARNELIWQKYRGTTDFVPYHQQRNIVITSLYTGRPDPQRRTRLRADSSLVGELRKSIMGAVLVVLHDELGDADTDDCRFIRTANTTNPYFQRHISAWQYLRDNPEIDFVWCVDGTDVKMLREPWPHMRRDVLYLGHEATVLDIPWMRTSHPARCVQDLIRTEPNRQLLNAGLIGGDRDTVMRFLQDIITLREENLSAVALGTDKDLGVGDMGALNVVAWSKWADRLEWGSVVNTVFKRNETNEWSWWKHK